jgi:hypothetical protein
MIARMRELGATIIAMAPDAMSSAINDRAHAKGVAAHTSGNNTAARLNGPWISF